MLRPPRRRLLVLALLAAGQSVAAAQEARDTAKTRRIPLTPELVRSAFADDMAQRMLERARAARIAQDSALQSYDAKSYLRMSVGLGVRRLGPERLLFRTEHAARVRWARASGVWVETTGRRHVVPMGGADLDLSPATPVPYFPGREALWFPSGDLRTVQAEVNEKDLLHPLATGAEAYYRYETGDSLRIRLPDGRGILLRELRITARKPDWRAFVGSFWFDADGGSLVRAAYRMAAEIDIWRELSEEQRRQIRELEERARTDTGTLATEARKRAEGLRDETRGARIGEGFFSPVRARLSAITVEYGLHEGRFWLPKLNILEGQLVASFLRVPVRYEESYRYDQVNGDIVVPKVPTLGDPGMTADDTSFFAQGNIVIGGGNTRQPLDTSAAAVRVREDSIVDYRFRRSDSLLTLADSLERAGKDSVRVRVLRDRARNSRIIARTILRRREECTRDSTYFAGTRSLYDGAVRMGIRLPCNTAGLASSPDLPASPYDADERLFSTADRDRLLEGLDFALQPGWFPQRPRLHTGLDLVRYNRIEGLSLGASLTSVLGLGYTAQAVARLGTADLTPNGELSLMRSNGRADVGIRLYHRLAVANDDWGDPLNFGASLANLLYARDEGFYYRAWGGEVAGTRDAPGPLGGVRMRWRVFGERQYSAGTSPRSTFSVGDWVADPRFADNIAASPLFAIGAATDMSRSFGADPRGFRFDSRVRAEGAAINRTIDSLGTEGYGRLVFEGTLSRPVGGFGWAITGAAGSSLGALPSQRAFYLGGLQTVRGQFARPTGAGRVGDTFWMGRAELARGLLAFRPSLFYDVGWAGSRDSVHAMGRPLSGAGVGVSMLDGLFRLDLSRGIFPERRWRADVYIGARF